MTNVDPPLGPGLRLRKYFGQFGKLSGTTLDAHRAAPVAVIKYKYRASNEFAREVSTGRWLGCSRWLLIAGLGAAHRAPVACGLWPVACRLSPAACRLSPVAPSPVPAPLSPLCPGLSSPLLSAF